MRRTSLLYQLIYGRSVQLRSYESLALQAAQEHLPQCTAEKFVRQLQHLPFRQRHSDDSVLAFFPDDGVNMPESLLFDNRQYDLAFAVVELRNKSTDIVLTGRLMASTGFFFSLEFDKPPKVAGITEGESNVNVVGVRIVSELDYSSSQ